MAVDWDQMVLAPNMAVFGECATYSPKGGSPFQVTGIFDEEYHEVGLLEGPAITSAMPVLGIRLAEFPSPPKQGDQLTVCGKTFAVREVRPDGHGGAKLMLNLASS
jgi:hypothetical protein